MIARVVVDTPLAHLDRTFDYEVPEGMEVVAGCRVKVRFAGRMVDGFVTQLTDTSEFDKLAPLAKVVSTESVLTPEVLDLARSVADRYAGTLNDVLRLAIPKRHARAEAAARPEAPPAPEPTEWQPSRVVWSVLPGEDPAERVAREALAALSHGRGTVAIVPDVRDVARWSEVFTRVLGPGRHVTLTAAESPDARYSAFLAAARGDVSVVLGTRAAAFAPVANLGLVAIWDDGDDLHAEPRAPYPHAREVLLLRAVQHEAGVIIAAHGRTAEAQSLVESRWCRSIDQHQVARRAAWPQLDVTDGSEGGQSPMRLPSRVVKAIREAQGPVLVQVPRRGYRTSLSCQDCRQPVRCASCSGPMSQPAPSSPLVCRWCSTEIDRWACGTCGGHALRAPVVGHVRTAEEFGQTFPDRTVLTSGGDAVLDAVDDPNALVLATPGAEPRAASGYGLIVLLDTWLMLARDDVRVVEEAHRRWFNALALAAPGGRAVAVGDAATLQFLVRADPVAAAERELADRHEAHLTPAARLAVVEGPTEALAALAAASWTPNSEVLGPVMVDEVVSRLIVRSPRAEGAQLAQLLAAAQAERSASKSAPLRVRVDPMVL